MVEKLLILDPAFAIPLNSDELYLLGCQAVVWGQIDFILDEILAHVFAFDPDQRSQFLTDKLVGTKTDMLAKDYTRLPNELHEDCMQFVAQINAIKPRRNSAFHSVWGWYTGKRGHLRQVAAFHHKTKKNPLKPIQLRGTLEDMIKCSKTGSRVMSACLGFPHKDAVRFEWGHEAPDGGPPERLRQLGVPLQKGHRPQDRRPGPRAHRPTTEAE